MVAGWREGPDWGGGYPVSFQDVACAIGVARKIGTHLPSESGPGDPAGSFHRWLARGCPRSHAHALYPGARSMQSDHGISPS